MRAKAKKQKKNSHKIRVLVENTNGKGSQNGENSTEGDLTGRMAHVQKKKDKK